MAKYSRKADNFKDIMTTIFLFVSVIVGFVTFALFIVSYEKEMLNDPKVQKVYEIESQYKDDYTKAIELDEVTITKDEDIKVVVETKNYELETTYSASGNYVGEKVSVKFSWAILIAGIFAGFWLGFIVYGIGGLITNPIYDKLAVKDKAINDEIDRVETEKFEERLGIRKKKVLDPEEAKGE